MSSCEECFWGGLAAVRVLLGVACVPAGVPCVLEVPAAGFALDAGFAPGDVEAFTVPAGAAVDRDLEPELPQPATRSASISAPATGHPRLRVDMAGTVLDSTKHVKVSTGTAHVHLCSNLETPANGTIAVARS
jgi:hypothetical protein